ncbi:sigma factor-like helix-turn-helix DNA-binding protein [Streptosporangium sp. NPDC051022]|uniref:sigma factor-like helix-turn-helix DNA-binding protein n=1 Tax=Streptosporangium sp. NPDC051022 TaxID=3155752 RepID=UPI00341E4FA9
MSANLRAVTTGSTTDSTADARLDGLTPAERQVFVLREAFSYGYREIAETMGLTETACRQLHRRAQQRTAARRRNEEPGAGLGHDLGDLLPAAA